MTSAPVRTTRRGRPPPARRPSVEQRLLAAMERLLEQGQAFGALSVEQLAAEAGIARATFYLHYRDKGELVAHLMGRVTEEVVNSAGLWFRDAATAQPGDLRRALRGIVGTFKKHQAIIAAMADTAAHDATVGALHERMMEQLGAHSRRAVAALVRAGRAGPAAGPDLADLLTRLVELYCARFIRNYRGRQVERLADLLAEICAGAILGPAGAAAAPRGGTAARKRVR